MENLIQIAGQLLITATLLLNTAQSGNLPPSIRLQAIEKATYAIEYATDILEIQDSEDQQKEEGTKVDTTLYNKKIDPLPTIKEAKPIKLHKGKGNMGGVNP